MRSIEWNPKGQALLAPMQRDAYERDRPIRRFDGHVFTDADGRVWFKHGETLKHIGDESRALDVAHVDESATLGSSEHRTSEIDATSDDRTNAPLPDRSTKTLRRKAKKPTKKSKK